MNVASYYTLLVLNFMVEYSAPLLNVSVGGRSLIIRQILGSFYPTPC